ncbi:hypothetical protein EXIGLDRAFT_307320 [Exidia glandulosa HHB12029]|uniref:Uncharacterized protein n=1 Tax=Exidia glandulosa HHB12029 TaxID=1314781 RepID=A0A165D1X8_EXIGL|nr:hypothetical protein EXIGLDRAFT_307320 [Exidia glandulosa HHB12029]
MSKAHPHLSSKQKPTHRSVRTRAGYTVLSQPRGGIWDWALAISTIQTQIRTAHVSRDLLGMLGCMVTELRRGYQPSTHRQRNSSIACSVSKPGTLSDPPTGDRDETDIDTDDNRLLRRAETGIYQQSGYKSGRFNLGTCRGTVDSRSREDSHRHHKRASSEVLSSAIGNPAT